MCYNSYKKTKTNNKLLNSKNHLKLLINNYFNALKENKPIKNNKIAYISSMAPVEILQVFGFKLYFPENHAVMIGAKRLNTSNIQQNKLNNSYNAACCSYMLADINADKSNNSPLNEYQLPPKPDLIIYNTNQCLEIKHWLNYYAEKYQVPMFGIETPHTINKNDALIKEYLINQYKQLIQNIENQFQLTFDQDKFAEIIKNSSKVNQLWQEVINYAKTKPAYISFFDLCIFIAPMVLMRGSEKAIKFYEILLQELEEKKKNHQPITENEKYRIIWCGLPIWGNLRYLSNVFNQLQTTIVGSTYTNSWIFNVNPNDPLGSMADSYSQLFINQTEQDKLLYLQTLVQEFKADGIIFHHSYSCRRNSDNYYGMSKKLLQQFNIPSITIEADHNNLQHFNDKQFLVLVEALIDSIKKKRDKN